jgi:ABC-type transport system involved in multi-copper enzyme maturation permease subunit
LWVLGVTAWQAVFGWGTDPSLGDTSRFGPFLFRLYCLVQFMLLLFFAALTAASAVAQEKDRRTFVLLLLTDLRNYEIVLGKLLGATLQVGLLLLLSVPVLAMLILLGGVSTGAVVQAVLIMGAAGLAAGSLGCLMALWRERTFQSLALTVLLIVLYLVVAWGVAQLPWTMNLQDRLGISFAAWLDPLLALQSVTVHSREPFPPALGFTFVMLLAAAVLNIVSMRKLRKWNPSGEPIIQRDVTLAANEAAEKRTVADDAGPSIHAAPGKARRVWDNPILWREIRTRAYGRRPLLVKLAYFVVVGLIACYALQPFLAPEGLHVHLGVPGTPLAVSLDFPPREKHDFMAAEGLVPVAVLSMLLLSVQAVTAITSERDIGALDLLLVTDISPREFILGKLLGVWYNAKEFILPPLLLALVYCLYHRLATPPLKHQELMTYRNIESFLCISGGLLLLLLFASVLGVHVALRHHNSRIAIVNTLSTVFFLTVGTLICIYLILINGRRFESQLASFVLFLLAGIGGLWWVLNAGRASAALTLASWLCPVAVLYTVTNILVARPGSVESTNALTPFAVVSVAFGFAVAAMLIPLISEFDVALGRTSGGAD